MLIRSKRSKKSQHESNLNRQHSTEGKKRARESEKLQATVQGGLSDLVRQSPNGILDDEQTENYFDGLREQSEMATSKQISTRNPKFVKTFAIRGGKFCQIN